MKILQNVYLLSFYYLLVKIGFDAAENEPSKVIVAIFKNYYSVSIAQGTARRSCPFRSATLVSLWPRARAAATVNSFRISLDDLWFVNTCCSTNYWSKRVSADRETISPRALLELCTSLLRLISLCLEQLRPGCYMYQYPSRIEPAAKNEEYCFRNAIMPCFSENQIFWRTADETWIPDFDSNKRSRETRIGRLLKVGQMILSRSISSR